MELKIKRHFAEVARCYRMELREITSVSNKNKCVLQIGTEKTKWELEIISERQKKSHTLYLFN